MPVTNEPPTPAEPGKVAAPARPWRGRTRVALIVAAVIAVSLGATGVVAAASSGGDQNGASRLADGSPASPPQATSSAAAGGAVSADGALTFPVATESGAAGPSLLVQHQSALLAASAQPEASVSATAPTPTPTPTPTYDTANSPCPAEAAACVDTAAKVAWLQHDGIVTRGPVPIETGQPGHMTPLGTFHVSWKTEYTVSNIYGLPMPYSVFWATGGIAFHEGPLDTPSHGCVHLREDDAKAFYEALNKGDEVVVW